MTTLSPPRSNRRRKVAIGAAAVAVILAGLAFLTGSAAKVQADCVVNSQSFVEQGSEIPVAITVSHTGSRTLTIGMTVGLYQGAVRVGYATVSVPKVGPGTTAAQIVEVATTAQSSAVTCRLSDIK